MIILTAMTLFNVFIIVLNRLVIVSITQFGKRALQLSTCLTAALPSTSLLFLAPNSVRLVAYNMCVCVCICVCVFVRVCVGGCANSLLKIVKNFSDVNKLLFHCLNSIYFIISHPLYIPVFTRKKKVPQQKNGYS